MLKPGDLAPDFELFSHTGEHVHLHAILEQSPVVLFFYPRAFTPVCTAEACGFREAFPSFRDVNATVLGISSDSQDTIQRFARSHRLPFLLLSDPGGRVRDLYGVPKMLGLFAGRATFTIATNRIIEHTTQANLRADPHIAESLRAVRGLLP